MDCANLWDCRGWNKLIAEEVRLAVEFGCQSFLVLVIMFGPESLVILHLLPEHGIENDGNFVCRSRGGCWRTQLCFHPA